MGDGYCPGRRLAITAALNPPAPVPQNTSGAGVPSATAHLPLYIAFKTPTSYAALAPPPESTRPTRWFELRKHPLVPLHWRTIQFSDRHIFSATGWRQVKPDFPEWLEAQTKHYSCRAGPRSASSSQSRTARRSGMSRSVQESL